MLRSSMDFDKLNPFSSCDVADALRKLGKKDFFIPDLSSFAASSGEFKFIGSAYTIKVEDVKQGGLPFYEEDFHWLDKASSHNVVILSGPKGAPNAVFGGLMGARAKYLGVQGVVVGGRIRDTSELKSFGLNVVAYGKSAMGAGGFTQVTSVNVPIEFPTASPEASQVKVVPGDIVVADQDGVVIVPLDCIDEVEKICKHIVEVDGKCMEDIVSGKTIFEAFKAHRS
ncbi:hypothetical protein DSO57_1016673 [Entomophthora muscae]|uniref:Uncharacterized protein n=2 Tax=Entomophthora muscae TaxID=34485 RepID=A0ACC2UE21_9FUNG|nr:hypothetical protein DSO57_1016673 [Entomophthora muscae]